MVCQSTEPTLSCFFANYFKSILMIALRAGGVPEHFNTPWYNITESSLLEPLGIDLTWRDCKGGTGEMCSALRTNELDIAVLLTEGMLTDISLGNESKIVKIYVNSSLQWGVHVHPNSPMSSVADLEGKKFAISRYKSGSHLMAYVHANNQGFTIGEDDFVVVGNADGAIESITNQESEVFLWEKYTTQPMVDAGHFKRIGVVPTPWPCFVVAVRNEVLQQNAAAVELVLNAVNNEVERLLKNKANTINLIATKFKLQPNQVESWFSELEWNQDLSINMAALDEVLNHLVQLKIIETKPNLDEMVYSFDSKSNAIKI